MPVIKKEKTKTYELLLWEIKESIDSLTKKLNPSKEEVVEINKFKNSKRKKQNIEVRIILNILSNKKTKLSYSDNGVPFCKTFNKISISHSNDYCGVIVSNETIGLDIQYKHENIQKLSKRFVNQNQKFEITNDINDLHFIWCSKEAIYKTLNGRYCSFKENIYIQNIKENGWTKGFYKNGDEIQYYNIYSEIINMYFISIVNTDHNV